MIKRTLQSGEVAYFDRAAKNLIIVESGAESSASLEELEALVANGRAKSFNEGELRSVSQALAAIALLGGPDDDPV